MADIEDAGGNDSGGNGGDRQSKVGRVIADRGLGDIGAELERYWTAEGEMGMSLRELADHFNRRVLEEAMETAGMQMLDGEAENLYELLTDDEASARNRIQAERRLEREGIDVDALRGDFVSHQAVHTYLTKYRDASAPARTDEESLDSVRETIQRLRNRVIAVVSNSLSSLRKTERLTLGEFNVFVNIHVMCDECGTQLRVSELFENGGCDCE